MEFKRGHPVGLILLAASILLLWPTAVHAADSALQALLVQRGNELNTTYQNCLGQFPPNLKEQLRIAQRAWIVFDNKNEGAFGLVGKRRGMSGEDLDRACLPETESRTEQLRTYFTVPNEDLAALRQDLARAEQDLTVAYKQAIATLAHDEEEKLRDTERAWIDYRDKDARAHLSDPSGRAPVWAMVRIARQRTAQLRGFYLQRTASLPAGTTALPAISAPLAIATPLPVATPPHLDPAVRAKLVAGFHDAVQGTLAEAGKAGVLTEATTLEDVKDLPTSLENAIDDLRGKVDAFHRQLDGDDRREDCRADLATANALIFLQKTTRNIRAADARSARAELALFHEGSPTPETEPQKPLWKSLGALRMLCDDLEAKAKIHLQRARSAADAGKNGDAIKEYQEAYRIYPDPDTAQTLKRLREDSLGL